jgi:hypothetical protein
MPPNGRGVGQRDGDADDADDGAAAAAADDNVGHITASEVLGGLPHTVEVGGHLGELIGAFEAEAAARLQRYRTQHPPHSQLAEGGGQSDGASSPPPSARRSLSPPPQRLSPPLRSSSLRSTRGRHHGGNGSQSLGGRLTGWDWSVSRPFPSWDRSILTEIYLCHACSCQEIFRTETAEQAAAKGHTVLYCQEGPGWKPPPSMLAAAVKGRQPRPANPYGHQWRAVPLSVGGDGPAGTVSATADLAALGGRYPHAVWLAWPLAGTTVGKDDDMCCVSQASLDGRAPCVPGNCPLYSAVSELPANPFFARCDPVSAALACAVRAHKR